MAGIFTSKPERLKQALSECYWFQHWTSETTWTPSQLRANRIFVLNGAVKEPAENGEFTAAELEAIRPYAVIWGGGAEFDVSNTAWSQWGEVQFYIESSTSVSNNGSRSFGEMADLILRSTIDDRPGLVELLRVSRHKAFDFHGGSVDELMQAPRQMRPAQGSWLRAYYTLAYGRPLG